MLSKSKSTNKKILFLSPYPHGSAAGQRFKFENMFEALHKEDYLIHQSSFLDLNTWNILYEPGNLVRKFKGFLKGYFKRLLDLFRIKNYDYVYIYLWGTPRGIPIYEFILRLLSKKIILDIDDEVFKATSILSSFTSSNRKSNFLTKHCDAVVHTSEFSSNQCRDINFMSNSYFIPCSMDMSRYEQKKFFDINKRKIVLGWTGTFSSKIYLDSIKNALIELDNYVDFKLVLITNFDYKIDLKDVEIIYWNKESEIKDLLKFDIGLYPILFDDWGLSKGGLKVQQYMSMGIPSVCTNHGAACSFIANKHNGFLVNSESEWVDTLRNLIHEPSLIKRIGLNARTYAEENFSISKICSKYLSVLEEI